MHVHPDVRHISVLRLVGEATLVKGRRCGEHDRRPVRQKLTLAGVQRPVGCGDLHADLEEDVFVKVPLRVDLRDGRVLVHVLRKEARAAQRQEGRVCPIR